MLKEKTLKAALMVRHGPISVVATQLEAQYLAKLIEETAQIACLQGTI